MVINTNISAQSSARLLSDSYNMQARSLARLSSGSKITSPEDDAAGLAVSTKFDAQISRIGAASSNVGNAISFSQTQDGYLQKAAKALDRMSELAILAQDVTKTAADTALYQSEFAKLGAYITDVASKTFNGVALFSSTALTVTSDADATPLTMDAVDLGTATATAVAGDISTNASQALTDVKAAIDALAAGRATVGANISVLKSYSSQLGVLRDNFSVANSRIKDVDVAEESATFARANILVQAGTAMLAQANQSTQGALKLLQ